MYAAGYLEVCNNINNLALLHYHFAHMISHFNTFFKGALTTDLMYAYYQSLYISEYNSTDLSDKVMTWLGINNIYMVIYVFSD